MGVMPEGQLVSGVLLPFMSALAFVHTRGFIHRDIKPENTLFTADKVLKVAGGCTSCERGDSSHGCERNGVGGACSPGKPSACIFKQCTCHTALTQCACAFAAPPLADFGLAIDERLERPVTRLGTLDYMSPEVLVCPGMQPFLSAFLHMRIVSFGSG